MDIDCLSRTYLQPRRDTPHRVQSHAEIGCHLDGNRWRFLFFLIMIVRCHTFGSKIITSIQFPLNIALLQGYTPSPVTLPEY